jgi:hypothetical protein
MAFGRSKRTNVFLVPTLHDEAPAYLSAYRLMARRARKLLWNTEAESVWEPGYGRSPASDRMGINTKEFSPNRPGYPYLLYCGRIDPFKGLPNC